MKSTAALVVALVGMALANEAPSSYLNDVYEGAYGNDGSGSGRSPLASYSQSIKSFPTSAFSPSQIMPSGTAPGGSKTMTSYRTTALCPYTSTSGSYIVTTYATSTYDVTSCIGACTHAIPTYRPTYRPTYNVSTPIGPNATSVLTSSTSTTIIYSTSTTTFIFTTYIPTSVPTYSAGGITQYSTYYTPSLYTSTVLTRYPNVIPVPYGDASIPVASMYGSTCVAYSTETIYATLPASTLTVTEIETLTEPRPGSASPNAPAISYDAYPLPSQPTSTPGVAATGTASPPSPSKPHSYSYVWPSSYGPAPPKNSPSAGPIGNGTAPVIHSNVEVTYSAPSSTSTPTGYKQPPTPYASGS